MVKVPLANLISPLPPPTTYQQTYQQLGVNIHSEMEKAWGSHDLCEIPHRKLEPSKGDKIAVKW